MMKMPQTPTELEAWLGLEMDANLPDASARLQAIDPFHSYIVQAPAGSGKTSLLTQRFLGLLAQVKAPEQIVAMTFTKKAAAEMRERIMHALALGLNPYPEQADLVQRNTWRLAQKALARDQEWGWQLLSNPNRLRIKTIDSFNSFLVAQMPLLSKMGTQLQPSDQPKEAYLQAVRQVLQEETFAPLVAELLNLVNGRYRRAEALLVAMLQKRDQWMDYLAYSAEQARAPLEASLQTVVQRELRLQRRRLSQVAPLCAELCELAAYAQTHDQPQLAHIAGAWPFAEQAVAPWRVLADWILTKDGKKWRSRLTKNEGFPAGTKGEAAERKVQMQQLLSALADADDRQGSLLAAFVALRDLPDPHYNDEQWQSLQGLLELLKMAAVYLRWVFQSRGEADFIEIAQAASQALGTEQEPTDLAQQLDYQIQHLLIDEFQDTSAKQYELVQKLVAGWQPEENRTLFVVGDPMQSIYRFREAEVANFLKAWQGALGAVTLRPLSLQVNFRSNLQLVEWVNRTFVKVLPPQDDMALGAVKFSPALSQRQDQEPAVFGHWQVNDSAMQSSLRAVAIIRQRLEALAQEDVPPMHQGKIKKIAILGRSRSHLLSIALQLKQHGIAFRAVELETLNERQEVQDLLALTQALAHLGDRAAWLALLRSPLMGLSLGDLHQLVGAFPYKTVMFCIERALSQPLEASVLSAEGYTRLQQAWGILKQAFEVGGAMPFSQRVKQAWLLLDGALTVENASALQNAESFFTALAALDAQGVETVQLAEMVSQLYAEPDTSEASQRVELMTMHKSKGLEFDTVLLPGLTKKPRADDNALLAWFGLMDEQGEEHLVLAPLDRKGQEKSYLSRLIKQFEGHKQRFELGRLLYVACTRAKVQLHLLGELTLKSEQDEADFQAPAGSLLEALWPALHREVRTVLQQSLLTPAAVEKLPSSTFSPSPILVSRLPLQRPHLWQQLGWELSRLKRPAAESKPHSLPARPEPVEGVDETQTTWQWEAPIAQAVGHLVHKVLEQWARQGIEQIPFSSIAERANFYQRWLGQQGLDARQVELAWPRAQQCLQQAWHQPKIRWALSAQQTDARNEYVLQSQNPQGEVALHIVDRTFVDAQGIRWIIDYKTSTPPAATDAQTRADFLAAQCTRYRPQLQRYAELFQAQETRPQKQVLYFAQLDEWIELNTLANAQP